MYLYGLEGNGFIISLGLTLLVAGAIMFYTLKRFAILENTIIEHGRILHSFINRMQARELEQPPTTQLASNMAVQSAIEQQSLMNDKVTDQYKTNVQNSDKINVSDNDDSNIESDSEYSTDSDNESNTISELDIANRSDNNMSDLNTLKLVENYNEVNQDDSVKIISIEDLQPDLNITEALNIHSSDSDSNLDSSTNLDTNSITDINNLDMLHVENEVKAEIKKGGITKMKVAELRELVIKQGLVNSVEDATKLKKDSLIKLLQSNY